MPKSLWIHKISWILYMWVISKDTQYGRILVLLVALMEKEVMELSKHKSKNRTANILVEQVVPKPP